MASVLVRTPADAVNHGYTVPLVFTIPLRS